MPLIIVRWQSAGVPAGLTETRSCPLGETVALPHSDLPVRERGKPPARRNAFQNGKDARPPKGDRIPD